MYTFHVSGRLVVAARDILSEGVISYNQVGTKNALLSSCAICSIFSSSLYSSVHRNIIAVSKCMYYVLFLVTPFILVSTETS